VAHLHYRPHCDTAKFSQWDSGCNFESFVHSGGIQGKRLAAHWPFSCSRVMTTVKCFWLPIQISLLIPQASNQTTERTPLEHLQEKIDAVSVPNLRPSELARQHTNPSEELRKLIVPMGSESLFVFPDKTYIFTTVSDIPPDTISDKGTWSLDADVLRLESDKDITWNQAT
jgi:hypothetical protein